VVAREIYNTVKVAQLRKHCNKFLIQPWLVGFHSGFSWSVTRAVLATFQLTRLGEPPAKSGCEMISNQLSIANDLK